MDYVIDKTFIEKAPSRKLKRLEKEWDFDDYKFYD
jgi:hypothetical protein